MTEKDEKQMNYINMFLSAVANSTNESLNHKYNCCVSHEMHLEHIGSGQSEDGIDLLNEYFLYNRNCNRVGYIFTDTFNEVFVPDLREKTVTKKDLYNVQNIHWAIDGLIDFTPSLSQWFIRPDGNFHKSAMDALYEQLELLIGNREYKMSVLFHPLEHLHYGKWLDNCYYLLLKIREPIIETCISVPITNLGEQETSYLTGKNNTAVSSANRYDFYFLECIAYG